jgi:hypothetical protein
MTLEIKAALHDRKMLGVTNVTASNNEAENRLTNSKTISNRCDTVVDGVTSPNPVALTDIVTPSVTPTAV